MKRIIFLILIIFLTGTINSQEKTGLENRVKEKISELKPELIKIRRHLHQYPELGNREFKTAELVSNELKKLGFKVTEKVAHTGVVGILEGRKKGRIVAVRADMDALPIQEENDLPFKSRNEGVMHACGHDIHTTVGLGTAKVLASLKDKFDGTVKFIFQPAEEGSPEGERGGASLMIEEGVLENPAPEAIFGLHVNVEWEAGQFAYVPGGINASNDQFEIIVKGVGSHAASPWKGIDPIVVSSHVILAIQNIRSRMTDTRDPLVITVGIIEGGTAFNIIPEKVRMVGTIRTHDPEFRIEVREKLKNVVSGICSSFGAGAEVSIYPGAPVNYNNPELTGWAVNVMNSVFGEDRVHLRRPSMGAEDFAHYSLKIPAFFYSLGVGNKEKGYTYSVHNPRFIPDETSIEYGVEAMSNLVLNFLKSKEKF